MTDEQQKLLNGPDLGGLARPKLQRSEGGPVFDFGPGWGFYVKRWLKKYFLKIIAPAVVIVIAVGVFTARRNAENGEEIITAPRTVKVMVVRGDGAVLIARKALAEYLKNYPEELTAGQKIFIEEILRKKVGSKKLIVAEEVSFDFNDIREAISQSKNLSLYQLQVWEGYAKRAGVK